MNDLKADQVLSVPAPISITSDHYIYFNTDKATKKDIAAQIRKKIKSTPYNIGPANVVTQFTCCGIVRVPKGTYIIMPNYLKSKYSESKFSDLRIQNDDPNFPSLKQYQHLNDSSSLGWLYGLTFKDVVSILCQIRRYESLMALK